MIRHYFFDFQQKPEVEFPFTLPSRRKERYPLPGLPLPSRTSLPVAFQNLFKKMVLFLIVPKGRFMTVLGGVV